MSTPIHLKTFNYWVRGFVWAEYLVNGFTDGFRLGYIGERHSLTAKNLKSCSENLSVITEKLKKKKTFPKAYSRSFQDITFSAFLC